MYAFAPTGETGASAGDSALDDIGQPGQRPAEDVIGQREDQEDLAAFEDRVEEPTMSYEALLKDLKAHGKL